MADVTLKAEQRFAMEAIYNRQDVFVWLPTGYGKSLCYQVPPFIVDYKHGVVEETQDIVCRGTIFQTTVTYTGNLCLPQGTCTCRLQPLYYILF